MTTAIRTLQDRCIVDGVPFTGILGWIWRARAVARSDRNPNLCTICQGHWDAGRLSESSVLFADCRDYTTATQTLGIETVSPFMEEFFRTAADVIVEHDGIVDHFMGDSVMAFFNVPIRHEDHVARAVAAALRIQMAVPQINAKLGRDILQVGIAIASGMAMTQSPGSGFCKAYTLVGDTVNIASRLQGQAAPGKVLVTETAYAPLKDAFPNARRQAYQLKGISEPVTAFALA